MPGLHFLSGQVSFSTPTPLLAASVLFMSTEHYPSDFLASYQSVYLDAFSRSIGSLASYRPPRQPHPHDTSTRAGVNGEGLSRRFDDVLGIILVGLVAIGWVDTVGLWVNAAYRLFLDGVHEDRGRRLSEWRGLWEGLRVGPPFLESIALADTRDRRSSWSTAHYISSAPPCRTRPLIRRSAT